MVDKKKKRLKGTVSILQSHVKELRQVLWNEERLLLC